MLSDSVSDDELQAEQRAWEIYRSHAEWIARVDVKASVLLALQGVTLGFVIALTDGDGPLAAIKVWWGWPALTLSVLLLLTAILFAVLVIAPRVRTKKPSRKAMTDYTYFGHTRWWKPVDLEAELRESALPILSRQITILGEIAWRKHLWAMWSTWVFVAAGIVMSALIVALNLWG